MKITRARTHPLKVKKKENSVASWIIIFLGDSFLVILESISILDNFDHKFLESVIRILVGI